MSYFQYTSVAHALSDLQDDVRTWANRNFGDVPSWQPLVGLQEELGELSHAFLKREQGIRGTVEEHNAAIRDAVADLMIYLLDFCSRENIDLGQELEDTWAKVSKREWKANPYTGEAS